jgi:hypothetical protein
MRMSTHPMPNQQAAFSSFAPRQDSKWAYAAMTIASNEAIADTGATQIFVMDGIPVHNRRKTTCPLKVALADGRQVMSTHMCDIIIPGLPTTLVGHIVPELSIASLFGIRVLTEAGCTVKFDIEKCVVKYNGQIILTGMKDPTTDLWTLPIGDSAGTTSQMDTHDKQDAFDNLRNEFLEKANATYNTEPLSLAIPPLCASIQACGTIQPGKHRLPTPPPQGFRFLHTHRTNQGQQHQVCTPINVQPHDLDTPQSNPTRVSQRMPQSLSQRSDTLPQPESSHRKRPHETAPSRYSKHHRTTTASATIRQTGSNRTSRPDRGRRQLDGSYIRASSAQRAVQSRPLGHRRGRRQLCRKYVLFCNVCRQANRSFVQRSHRVVPLHVPRGQCVLPHRVPLRIQCDPRATDIRVR